MSEKVTPINRGVSLRTLERAAVRLSSKKYPAKTAAIHREILRLDALERLRTERKAA